MGRRWALTVHDKSPSLSGHQVHSPHRHPRPNLLHPHDAPPPPVLPSPLDSHTPLLPSHVALTPLNPSPFPPPPQASVLISKAHAANLDASESHRIFFVASTRLAFCSKTQSAGASSRRRNGGRFPIFPHYAMQGSQAVLFTVGKEEV